MAAYGAVVCLLACVPAVASEGGADWAGGDVWDVFDWDDELDLPPGKVRVKHGGGLAGHNGLRSINAHCGPGFWRMRVGIGHPGQPEKVSGIEGSQKCMYTSGGTMGPTFVCTGREWAVATQGNCMSGAPPPIDQEVCDFLAQTHCLKEGNCTASHALPQCTESVHRAVQHCAVQCFNMKTGEDPQCDACLVSALSTVESFTRGVPDIYGCCGCFGTRKPRAVGIFASSQAQREGRLGRWARRCSGGITCPILSSNLESGLFRRAFERSTVSAPSSGAQGPQTASSRSCARPDAASPTSVVARSIRCASRTRAESADVASPRCGMRCSSR